MILTRFLLPASLLTATALSLSAAITISGVVDKTKYSNTVTFTVTADASAATTTATLDGAPVAVGSAVVVTSIRYHELKAESRTAGNVLVDSKTIRFIVHDSTRNGSEDGIPPFTPYRTVDDAPSAFAGGVFRVIAPAAWPVGLPVPMAFTLRSAANDPLWLNGKVTLGGWPANIVQMRRGWGSVVAPAATAVGTININAQVGGLVYNPAIAIVAASGFTDVSGTISSNTNWPANSRIHVTGTLTVNAGATLTIGEGSIITLYAGSGAAGSAAEIVVNGALVSQGSEAAPVVFAPDTATGKWGGIELPSATSSVTATHTIFTGSGEDQTWFDTHSGYTIHKPQQALFLVAGSGSGTAVGAQIHLTECYCFSLAGQEMNSKTNTWIDLQRTLMQRAVTCGELNGSKLTIDRSALIEFPSEDATFVDGDNDALYLTNGDLSISNTVIGFTKDDGVDSGGNGGDNPFTSASDVTPFVSTHNWFEGTYHEGNSLSGSRNVFHTGCVFVNCGQGVEAGYSASSTGDGPNATIDGCLFVGNMVGVRWGDNYGPGYSYNAAMEVKNSIVLNSWFRDAFSGNWHPTDANAWIYQTTASNTYGHAYFNVHDSFLSQPDPVNHPLNTTWVPATHGTSLAAFMPVPGSPVGVSVCSYAAGQAGTSDYPGTFTIRLSTFSSLPVGVDWGVVGQSSATGAESVLASGTLEFAPGEIIKTISAPVGTPTGYSLLRLALTNPVNAEVTGEAWYFQASATPSPTLVAKGSSGWRYRETRSEPPAAWKTLAFDDSSPTATEWLPCTLPAGFAYSGVVTTVGYGSSTTDKTKAYYFRKKFTVSDPSLISSLTFNVRRDDGVVLWLNNDSSATAVSADGTWSAPYTYANLSPNATNTAGYISYTIPASKLVAGDNILAIELHQTSVTSSDLLLDCELLATWVPPLVLEIRNPAGQPVLYWFDNAALLEESGDLTNWSAVPGGQSPFPFTPAGPARFFRLRK
jgi:hypothetical protein